MTEYLSECQHRTLPGRIFRHVRRLLVNVDGIQEDPHRVGRVSQSSMGESVAGQQIAKFVMSDGHGHRRQPQHAEPGHNGCRGDHNQHQGFSAAHARGGFLYGAEERIAQRGRMPADGERRQHHQTLDEKGTVSR